MHNFIKLKVCTKAVKDVESEISELQLKLTEKDIKIENLEQEKVNLQNLLSELQSNFEKVNDNLQDLETSAVLQKSIISDSKERIVQLEQELEILRSEIEALKTSKNSQNIAIEVPEEMYCDCKVKTEEPAYYQLGHSHSLESLKTQMKAKLGPNTNFKVATYYKKIFEDINGCPTPSLIVQRENEQEKYLVVIKKLRGHSCDKTFVVIQIVCWDGINRKYADYTYDNISGIVGEHGFASDRENRQNKTKSCKCQGKATFFTNTSVLKHF